MEQHAAGAGSVFFRPAEGWVGDLIPHEEDGVLHLFYLLDDRDLATGGMPWHRVTTTDLVHFEDRGVALPAGSAADDDFNCYTGSVLRTESGEHHLFYTAQNPKICGDDGRPLQLVAHATSTDEMATWTKHPEHTFGATPGHETGDWRDPFVHRHPDGHWQMLLAARHLDGPERRRGVVARLVSDDLVTWTPAEPLWDPRRYITQECPELFEWNGWWYLVYSEFSDRFVTRYKTSRSPDGPWTTPDLDTLDGRAWYAAKSAALGGRRLFFGWIATREGARDDGAWQWAGTLSVLEAHQRPDGSLDVRPPAELVASFDQPADVGLAPTTLDVPDAYTCVVSEHPLPVTSHTRVVLDVAPGTTEAGLLLRCSPDGDTGYVLRLEPRRGRMVLDRWPRPRLGDEQWQVSGDVPHLLDLERPAHLPPGRHVVEVLLDHDVAVITLDGAVTLSTRLHDHPTGRLGVLAGEGRVDVVEATTRTRTSPATSPSTR